MERWEQRLQILKSITSGGKDNDANSVLANVLLEREAAVDRHEDVEVILSFC
jgi:hypothetical protein